MARYAARTLPAGAGRPHPAPTTGAEAPRGDVVASARGLVKVHGEGATRVRALDGVDLDVVRGEFVAVMGASGSGKSTLMHCMAGLDSVTAGRVTLAGRDITAMRQSQLTRLRRAHVGFVFQAYNLVPTLTALENITLPLEIARRRVDRAHLARVVEAIGLGDRLDHRPGELSGGEQQRVACARALLTRPAVIFADEPTGNLDSASAAGVLELLRASADGLDQAIVMVTHEAAAAAWADRVLVLADGAVAGELDAPDHERIRRELERLDRLERRDRREPRDPGAPVATRTAP